MTVVLVVNPMSAGGRTGSLLGALGSAASEAFGDARLVVTSAPREGTRLAAEAAREGASLVLAVGGDGTMNEVVDGLMSVEGPRPAVGLVPAGTGGDLARTLGMPRDPLEAVAALANASVRPVDVMRGTFTGPDGVESVRHGINVSGLGMAGDVVRRVNASSKRLGGRVTFLISTVTAALAWRGPKVLIRWVYDDGTEGTWTGPLSNLFANNGRYCGGGMLTGAHAAMDDGLVDLVIVPQLALHRMFAMLPHLYDGRLESVPGVVSARCSSLTAQALEEDVVPCDLDGEQPGDLPARIEVIPGALRLRSMWD